ncbi:hypothetical protein DFP73DRAFT_554479 [Morchella snyderi]|nr:hypothetical protein DFP73DRAFT_554479 [Morchella snyderi]
MLDLLVNFLFALFGLYNLRRSPLLAGLSVIVSCASFAAAASPVLPVAITSVAAVSPEAIRVVIAATQGILLWLTRIPATPAVGHPGYGLPPGMTDESLLSEHLDTTSTTILTWTTGQDLRTLVVEANRRFVWADQTISALNQTLDNSAAALAAAISAPTRPDWLPEWATEEWFQANQSFNGTFPPTPAPGIVPVWLSSWWAANPDATSVPSGPVPTAASSAPRPRRQLDLGSFDGDPSLWNLYKERAVRFFEVDAECFSTPRAALAFVLERFTGPALLATQGFELSVAPAAWSDIVSGSTLMLTLLERFDTFFVDPSLITAALNDLDRRWQNDSPFRAFWLQYSELMRVAGLLVINSRGLYEASRSDTRAFLKHLRPAVRENLAGRGFSDESEFHDIYVAARGIDHLLPAD